MRSSWRSGWAARAARKQLLAAVAAGEQTIPAVLDGAKTDTVVGKTRVIDLLTSLPGYGPAKVTALLEQDRLVSSRRRPGRPPPPGAVRRTDIAGPRQALQARCSLAPLIATVRSARS